jgi:hypothetical protein
LSTESHKLIVDRYWWKRFMARHEELSVRRCDSREVVRTSICGDHIVPYIDALAEMLSRPFHPDLVINIDESVFISRPLKGTRKNCVFLQNSTVKPRFLEKPDANHVTLVGTVTLSGYSLLPLLLSTTVHLPDEIDLS